MLMNDNKNIISINLMNFEAYASLDFEKSSMMKMGVQVSLHAMPNVRHLCFLKF